MDKQAFILIDWQHLKNAANLFGDDNG